MDIEVADWASWLFMPKVNSTKKHGYETGQCIRVKVLFSDPDKLSQLANRTRLIKSRQTRHTACRLCARRCVEDPLVLRGMWRGPDWQMPKRAPT